jgi:hypothetical protein
MTTQRILITEVHNFGGFFGGDTVTFDAVPWRGGDETTWTIDEKAFQNISDRYLIAADIILDVALAGERVDQAWVRAARQWNTLKPTLPTPSPAALAAPQVRAYRCDTCALWVLGEPIDVDGTLRCVLCEQPLQAV